MSSWKKIALDNLESLFASNHALFSDKHDEEIKNLHAKVGELTVERDFLDSAFTRIR